MLAAAMRGRSLAAAGGKLVQKSAAGVGMTTRGLAAAAGGRQFNRTEFRKPDESKPKLVLAYSGGLDTSTQLAYLVNELGFEVAAYIADLGQDDVKTEEDKEEIKRKAELSGAYAFYCEDLRQEFVDDFVYPMIAANAIYEGRYLLGTSIARPAIGKRQVEICHNEGATHISHGSTGKGNDQVRFELCYLGMDPNLKCVTLWRDPTYCDKFQGRQDLIDYASQFNIPISQTKKHSYSEDENMLHISYESGELEDPAFPGTEDYPGMVLKKKSREIMDTPDQPVDLTISFESGIPSKVVNKTEGKEITGSLEIFDYLNTIGGEHGVGRIDIVENRYVGLKSRGCYETPGGSILYAAHHDLELLCLDREVMRIRDQLSLKYAELVYNGYWFSPEMAYLKHSMEYAQRTVTGEAHIRLHKANIMCRGRSSPNSLYSEALVSMDEHGGFDPTAGTGFINTLANRLKATKKRDTDFGTNW
ncbi:Argininosuccinate synthase [Hondaea fermentalgiana]|uniref:argininosuccinate synthase n=1 Tax=Hondaea fermentalgiana TaxID=2315210 RepID=A0A2R5G7Y0_9STRA|nr:Argininosuccinate synthase [Hondaea fermentalgiana]|eukprot:GBG23804.1 Argininosuccinate synthase [Hondaea fermentalgiana]